MWKHYVFPVEHILSLMSAFAGAEICFPNQNSYEGFIKHFYPWVFNTLPYSPILGGLTQVTFSYY